MIDLDAQHSASRRPRLPVTLEFVRDLVDLDGPLVSEFKSDAEETFLYVWCDREKTINRWLVVRTARQQLFEYLVGRISLVRIIRGCKDGAVHVVDLNRDAHQSGIWYVSLPDLPQEYLPNEDSFHSLDSVIEEGFQDVYVGAGWDNEDVATYPRRYFQTYAFHYAFGPGGDHSSTSPILYRLTKGWIFNTLYLNMRAHIPREKRPKLQSVSYASPGFLRFSVDQTIADGIRESLTRYMSDRSTIDEAVSDLSKWSTGRTGKAESAAKQRRKKPRRERERITTEDLAQRILRDTCSRLAIDGAALLTRTLETKRAIRILASYRRRLAFLSDREQKEQAMLVGLVPVPPAREGSAQRS